VAAVLGLQAPIENGPVTLLQLPALLPSQTLLDTATNGVKPDPAAGPAAFQPAEEPTFARGADVLRSLAPGRVRGRVGAGWLR